MGTWGVNLYQDDTALDVKEEYKYKDTWEKRIKKRQKK